ncbi:hypothetical protein CEXT_123451 [Caerostris extrusa]|uniref:Uncharacterized protein n=1 Tax=Caerostris extrusa TaxID=172846 RepID=A0AAV4MT59_CAEEX|nr:hypothetical protein CEXT_123451 [Caerostris extrusa]
MLQVASAEAAKVKDINVFPAPTSDLFIPCQRGRTIHDSPDSPLSVSKQSLDLQKGRLPVLYYVSNPPPPMREPAVIRGDSKD